MPKNLVIVESPAKAKTIEKYLGKDFHVMSSVGHIRTDTKVDVEHNFTVTYEIDPGHKKVVSELKKAAKEANTIWLATDEDREGESISWHLMEVLKLPKDTHRITFHEITEPALKAAIASPRTVDMNMVSSQQARQTLDMLVGFDLSGVVRRKVPGAISAGRVQSPALRLIVEKEREIENFATKSSYKVTAKLPTNTDDASFELTSQTGEQATNYFPAVLEKHPVNTADSAEQLLTSIKGQPFVVKSVQKTTGTKANPVPFATAALQIEANSRLGFSSRTTMSAAQSLYQAGHITYHRTDSLNLSKQAVGQIAHYIEETYGKDYLHIRTFKTRSAGAQEAHEAIRPTHIEREVAGKTEYEKKLYRLIRSRTLATQMENAKVAKTTATLSPENRSELNFIAKGESVIFDGFLKVYGNSKEIILPNLQEGQRLPYQAVIAHETFATPPARYTEGSLVKKLEELGIGRPSTYASIMTAIQARGYVKKGESEGKERAVQEIVLTPSEVTTHTVKEKTGSDKGKLLPTPVGELVSDFLVEHFDQIVDYGFTAEVETQLDEIAEARLERVKMLRDFYTPFSKLIDHSAFIDRYNAARELGIDPKTGKKIYVKIGKNGGFIQLGENEKESGEKPRFASLPKNTDTKNITIEQALKQLALPALPRSLGKAKDGAEIIAAAGPFGPYLKAGSYNIPIKRYDPYTTSLADAEPLYEAKKASILADYGTIQVVNGAYGPYIKGPGRRNFVKIPKDTDPKSLTKEQCEQILAEKGRRPVAKTASRKASKAKTSRKTRTSKASAKSTTKKRSAKASTKRSSKASS